MVQTCRLVHLMVGLSFRRAYCGKTADWIWMPFGAVSVVGRGTGVLDGGPDRRRRRGSFGDRRGLNHCLMVGWQVLHDATWTRYLNYRRVEYVVYGLSLAHFACNFFIFIPTARHFRRALLDLLACRRDDWQTDRRNTGTQLLALTAQSRTPSPIVRRQQ